MDTVYYYVMRDGGTIHTRISAWQCLTHIVSSGCIHSAALTNLFLTMTLLYTHKRFTHTHKKVQDDTYYLNDKPCHSRHGTEIIFSHFLLALWDTLLRRMVANHYIWEKKEGGVEMKWKKKRNDRGDEIRNNVSANGQQIAKLRQSCKIGWSKGFFLLWPCQSVSAIKTTNHIKLIGKTREQSCYWLCVPEVQLVTTYSS